MTGTRTYLDYNATAPLRPEARAAVVAALEVVGNPSSVHAEGRAARALIEDAREKVAALVGALPQQPVDFGLALVKGGHHAAFGRQARFVFVGICQREGLGALEQEPRVEGAGRGAEDHPHPRHGARQELEVARHDGGYTPFAVDTGSAPGASRGDWTSLAWVVAGIAANAALMALSGWFIASMAVAGVTAVPFNYFFPSAAIRALSRRFC